MGCGPPLGALAFDIFGAISGTFRMLLGGLFSVLFRASMIASFVVGLVGECESGLSSVRSRFSKPSTRFSRASRTSVFGPRFLGTASGDHEL